MAIDSRVKRASISGIHLYAAGTGVTPDATQPTDWRQASGYSYSGINIGPETLAFPHRLGWGAGYSRQT